MMKVYKPLSGSDVIRVTGKHRLFFMSTGFSSA